MSLNPVTEVPPQGLQFIPPMPGEIFLLVRDGVEFTATATTFEFGTGSFKARGTVLLSNVRILFVASRPSVQHQVTFTSFDFPLRGIYDCTFNQPIFFANNLTGKTLPVNCMGTTAPIDWKISFKEGGTGSFVPILLRLLGTIARESAQSQQTPPQPTPQPPEPYPVAQAYAVNGPSDPQYYTGLTSAYVDPTDPTMVLVSSQATAPPVAQPTAYVSYPPIGKS